MKDAPITYETYCQRDLQEPHFPAGHDSRRWSPTVGETIALASFYLRQPINEKCCEYISSLLESWRNREKMETWIADWNQALANSSPDITRMQKLYPTYLFSALIEERVDKYKLEKEDLAYSEESRARGNYEDVYDMAVEDVKGLAAVKA